MSEAIILFKNMPIIGQSGGNTCVLLIISDGASLGNQETMIRGRTQKHLDEYAEHGLRTLCIAKRVRPLSTPVVSSLPLMWPLLSGNWHVSNPDPGIGESLDHGVSSQLLYSICWFSKHFARCVPKSYTL